MRRCEWSEEEDKEKNYKVYEKREEEKEFKSVIAFL
jgi:hypothetical protein